MFIREREDLEEKNVMGQGFSELAKFEILSPADVTTQDNRSDCFSADTEEKEGRTGAEAVK